MHGYKCPIISPRTRTAYRALTVPVGKWQVDVDEAELMKLEFSLSRGDNFLRRRDGSVTNW